jgi:site-specific recombinase XerD
MQRMAHLVEAFGNRRAEDIKPDEIKAWLDSKADQWSQSTRNRHIALMKLTYRLAEQGGAIKTNPVRQVKQTAEDNERNRPLSPAEEDRLRAVILKSYSDFLPEFEVALMTGMRQSEQFQRDWHNVDLDTGTIRLAQTKNGKSRIVRLNSRAKAAMNMLHSMSIGTGKVFSHAKPRWFTKAVREAKIEDFTWHDLRHTWATRLVAAGVDLKTVQDLGGWKNIGMVARYAHADKARFGSALEKLCEATDTKTDTKQSEAETMVSPAILQ